MITDDSNPPTSLILGSPMEWMPDDVKPLISILKRIAELLRANRHVGQAEYVAAVATIAEWDSTAVEAVLTSGAMWGGSGSVWEVGEFNTPDELRRFREAIIELANEMSGRGMASERAEFCASVFAQSLR